MRTARRPECCHQHDGAREAAIAARQDVVALDPLAAEGERELPLLLVEPELFEARREPPGGRAAPLGAGDPEAEGVGEQPRVVERGLRVEAHRVGHHHEPDGADHRRPEEDDRYGNCCHEEQQIHDRMAVQADLAAEGHGDNVRRPPSAVSGYFSIPFAMVCSCMLLVPS